MEETNEEKQREEDKESENRFENREEAGSTALPETGCICRQKQVQPKKREKELEERILKKKGKRYEYMCYN